MKTKYRVKDLRKIFTESTFNPNLPDGPLKIVLDSGDASYLETRAKEFISEAQLSIVPGAISSHQLELYNDKMIKAISLLGMARLIRNQKK